MILDEAARLELKQAAVDLRSAADVTRHRGWCRGAFIDAPRGKVCVLGALRVVIAGEHAAQRRSFIGTDEVCRRYDAAFVALSDHLGHPVAWWNDTECDDGPHAAAALEAAADRCDQQAAAP